MNGSSTKFPPVHGLTTRDLHAIFRMRENARENFDPITLIRRKEISAVEAEPILRGLVEAGYISWSETGWEILDLGYRVAVDHLHRPIPREGAEKILQTVIERARRCNQRNDGLYRITDLRLFGSLLDPSRETVGDVDLFYALAPIPMPKAERDRIVADAAERAPQHLRHRVGITLAGLNLLKREIRQALSEGLRELSLTSSDPEMLGTQWRSVFRFDVTRMMELPVEDVIVTPPEKAEEDIATPIPEGLPILSFPSPPPENNKPLAFPHPIELRGILLGEANFLHPARPVTPTKTLLAGALHLCPTWKEKRSALDMIRATLSWAREKETRVLSTEGAIGLEIGQKVRARLYDRTSQHKYRRHLAWLDMNRTKGFDAHCSDDLRMSRNDIAVLWSMSCAMERMLRELKIVPGLQFRADIDLHDIAQSAAGSLPRITAVADLARDAMTRVMASDLDALDLLEVSFLRQAGQFQLRCQPNFGRDMQNVDPAAVMRLAEETRENIMAHTQLREALRQLGDWPGLSSISLKTAFAEKSIDITTLDPSWEPEPDDFCL